MGFAKMNELLEKAKKVKCLICDIDGVLTDGLLYISSDGVEMKAFNVQDGMGLKLLLASGIEVAVITTANNDVIDHRMKQLGIRCYFKGQVDKRKAYQTLKNELNLVDGDFAYIGDDLPDLPIIQQVGFGVAVANAVKEIKEYADWITQNSGGRGGVRELCDLILTATGKQTTALTNYLNHG
jgi:3-deoxy-D-manno-octulosonate 8-phosphate phosphatase (KDO 8-P phosphatase)